MNIHSITLVWLSEKRNIHFILGLITGILAYYFESTSNQTISILPIRIIMIFFTLNIIWELIGFPGIFSPVKDPEYVSVEEGEKEFGHLLTGREVIGIYMNGESRAVPIDQIIMNHIINDTIGENKVAITHCALCNSSHAFNRIVDGEEIVLHAAVPIIRSNLVLVDQKGNLWQQITGKSLKGGKSDLEFIDINQTTWEHWKAKYPDTKVAKINYSKRLKIGYSYFTKILGIHQNPDSAPLFPTGRKAKKYSAKTQCAGIKLDTDRSVVIPLYMFKKPEIKVKIDDKILSVVYNEEKGIKQATIDDKKLKITVPVFYFAWMGTYPDAIDDVELIE